MKSKKILSLLLTIAMVLSVVMPTGVLAEETAPATENYGFVINDTFDDGTLQGWSAGISTTTTTVSSVTLETGEKVLKADLGASGQGNLWANLYEGNIFKEPESSVAFTGNNLIRIKAKIKNASSYEIKVNRPDGSGWGCGLPQYSSGNNIFAVAGIKDGFPIYGAGIPAHNTRYKTPAKFLLKADGTEFDTTGIDFTDKWVDYTVIINGATNEQFATVSFEHNDQTVTLKSGSDSTFLQTDEVYSNIGRGEEKTFEVFERLTFVSQNFSNTSTLYIDSVSVENLPLTNIKAEVIPNDGELIYKPETLDIKFNGDINYVEGGIVIRNKDTDDEYTNGTYNAETKTYTANFGGMLAQGDYELDLTAITPVDHLPSDGITPVFENTVIDFRVYTSKPPTLNSVVIEGRLVPDTGVLSVKSYDFQVENDTEGTHHYQWLISDTIDGDYTEIPEATNSTLSITEALATKYIKLRMAIEGSFSGFLSNTVESNALIPEEKPIIKNFSLSTTLPMEGTDLSAVYTYEDVNGDEENGTVIKWYVSDTDAVDDLGTEMKIGDKYEITAMDNGKYIYCTVQPKNDFDYLGEGDLYTSQKVGPVFNEAQFLDNTNLLQNPSFENELEHYSATGDWTPNIEVLYGEARTGDISLRLHKRDTDVSLHALWGQDVAVETGKRYVAGCYAKSVDSNNRTIENFYAYGNGFNLLDTDVNGEDKSKTNLSYLKFHKVVSALETTSDSVKLGFTSFTSRAICDANVDDLYFGELYISDLNTNYTDRIEIPQEGEKKVSLTNGEIYNQLGTQHGLYDQTVVVEIPATKGVYVDGHNLVVTEEASAGTIVADIVVRPSYSGALQAEIKKTMTIELLSHGNSAPRATDVVISGTFGAGNTLTGTYKFLQIDGKADNSRLQWMYADEFDGTYSPISGANTLNYTIDSLYADKFICMEVTPVADDGSAGTPVRSNVLTKERAPFMENVEISGNFIIGGTLTATGNVCDYNGLTGGETKEYQWYVSDSIDTTPVAIAGATTEALVLDESYTGKYIRVGITPVSTVAPMRGAETLSKAYAGPAVPAATNVSISKSGMRLTAQYTYTHIHGIKEKDTTYEWSIDGRVVSTSSDYTINFEGTKTVTLAITPRAEFEPCVGQTVYKTVTLTGATGGSGGGYVGGGGGGGVAGGSSAGGSTGGSVSGVTSVNDMTLTDPSKEVPEVKTDIRGHWGETYIKEMEKGGVMTADENGNFNPDKNVSRENMLTFLFKALKLEATDYKNEFNDVTDGDFAKMLQTMVDNGTIAKDESFRPDDTITREEMCKILYISLKNAGKLIESDAMVIEGFEDYSVVSDWAKVYVNAIYSNKIMVGISDTHFDPKGTVTKAQAATMLVRINRLIEGGAEK